MKKIKKSNINVVGTISWRRLRSKRIHHPRKIVKINGIKYAVFGGSKRKGTPGNYYKIIN